MTDHEQILKELDRVAEEFSEMTKSFVDVLKRVEALEVAVFGKAGIGGLTMVIIEKGLTIHCCGGSVYYYVDGDNRSRDEFIKACDREISNCKSLLKALGEWRGF